ncbi:hypothetical protein ADUPG1_001463, partial [Aduncisulcus paluster]
MFNVDPFWLLGQESMDNETGPEKAESAGSCKQCESYKEELAAERKLLRELVSDNREMSKQLLDATRQIGELREERASLTQRRAKPALTTPASQQTPQDEIDLEGASPPETPNNYLNDSGDKDYDAIQNRSELIANEKTARTQQDYWEDMAEQHSQTLPE